MAVAAATAQRALHPRAIAFTVQARGIERRLGLLFAGTGVVLVAGMGILGLIMPDEGSILVDGWETVGIHAKERDKLMSKFGMLFQGAALFDSMKVWENVAFGLLAGRGMNRRDAKEIAVAKMKAVGLDEAVGNLYPAELSGGMQKRIGLARAIAVNPEIIFFDEPTTGLDPINADLINDLIVETVKDVGTTALSITHDMASARKIADYIAMIYQGKIIWQGPVGDLDNSGNEYVDQFIHGRGAGPITDDLLKMRA